MSNIILPAAMLGASQALRSKGETFYRDGIPLEKGAVLTEKRIRKNLKLYQQYMELFISYPDLYLELIKPIGSKFKLKFFQVMFLRACLRYGRVLTIAPRAAGKSFICILALYLICIFRPGSHVFQCAPGKAQGAKISNQKIHQLWDIFPLLKDEIIGGGNFGNDYVRLTFKNGSLFDVMTPLNSTRGNRATCGILDEFRDHDADDINEIILPLLNVDRPMVNGDMNPEEPQQVQLWITSASEKNTFCYDKTVELFEQQIINPSKTFVWGFDYRIPVLTGLLSKDYLTELKMSPTFNELGFAKEYMSRFVGGSAEAWFDYEKLARARKLINPETSEKVREGIESFYIISVDVARLGCQTVATVLKVFPNVTEGYKINLVNIFILGKTMEEKVFDHQVIELKRLMAAFNPREVVIDINGLGVAFADTMIKETPDPQNGVVWPAYGFFNRDEYLPLQPRGCSKILYGIKANSQINSDMHSALYAKIYSGHMKFLISEQNARSKLLATRKGQRMSPEAKAARLMPHELTSVLISEIMNLKIKPTGVNNQIAVEQINERMLKDKFSALEMGVWRIVQLENEAMSRRRNRGLSGGKGGALAFGTSRGGGVSSRSDRFSHMVNRNRLKGGGARG